MRIAYSLLLTLHAIIHIMGFAKAFGLASLTQLKIPSSRPMGVLWLAAALLLIAAVAALFTAPRWFWLVGSSCSCLRSTESFPSRLRSL